MRALRPAAFAVLCFAAFAALPAFADTVAPSDLRLVVVVSRHGVAPVFVPGCPGLDCPLATFDRVANAAIDPAFVATW
jgi:hypothetical protein